MTSSIWPGWLAFALNLVGAGFVAYSIAGSHVAERPPWVLVVGMIAVVTWAARSLCALLGARRLVLVFAVVSAATGSLVTPATDGVAVVPAAIAILVLVGDIRWPAALGLGTAFVSVALIVAGALPFDTAVAAVLGELAGILLATFAGLSRRQFRRSEEQSALLRDREAEMREEAARVALARDLHDVLAHSLGGLVVQLDAVDALLEAGDTEEARRRAVAARGLAADGLADARRAVAALRDPESATTGTVGEEALAASLDDLIGAHRALGATADLTVTGRPCPLAAAQAAALQRALQEALSNARKHAPGQPVRADLDWKDDRVTLRVCNPLPAGASVPGELARSGGGHGLEGMRERFAALPLGGTATAGADGDRFAVTAEARLA
ncbi:two-component sensor histidine kinase [Leifsonia sp. ZF2019]|uniref:sensor histidine kinase n=1 Tax=Leifsonia sp. ZF2019 TaxID=2781978 RepID=UPI001CBD73C2|nr:histidine kinase [Leifsonia sp. ZF2019]UAJ78766.1 two-component sensor histidine kinase [Leifsonia sp. ZF2019]